MYSSRDLQYWCVGVLVALAWHVTAVLAVVEEVYFRHYGCLGVPEGRSRLEDAEPVQIITKLV